MRDSVRYKVFNNIKLTKKDTIIYVAEGFNLYSKSILIISNKEEKGFYYYGVKGLEKSKSLYQNGDEVIFGPDTSDYSHISHFRNSMNIFSIINTKNKKIEIVTELMGENGSYYYPKK